MGAGPHPCGGGAVRGFARRHLASAGEGASAHLVALLESRAAAAWRARPGRGHAGYPHRGARGDRCTGRRHRCTFTRARTATGWGTPYLKIVVLMVFAPRGAGDEPPPCLSARGGSSGALRTSTTRRSWRSAWRPGKVMLQCEGRRGKSHLLLGVATLWWLRMLCVLRLRLMSGTLAFL